MELARSRFSRCVSWTQLFLVCALGLLARGVQAHHGANTVYFRDQTIEVRGEITAVLWRNPHARFTLAVRQPDGGTVEWGVETIPVTRLTRVGVTSDMFGIGEIVTVAGYPSRLGENVVYATNLLLADEREILLDTPTPHWTSETLGTGIDNTPGTPSADPSLGIFRVWSTDGRSFGDRNPPLPYTDEARRVAETYDSLSSDNIFRGCIPKGMPLITQQPNPISFEDRGDHILLRMEEYDTVRTIWMGPDVPDAELPSLLGHSVGYWEDGVLVVRTSQIDYPYFNQQGYRQSSEMTLLERFIPSADGARLDYEQTITDPALFDGPVTRVRTWIWVPGAEVLPFDCTEG